MFFCFGIIDNVLKGERDEGRKEEEEVCYLLKRQRVQCEKNEIRARIITRQRTTTNTPSTAIKEVGKQS